MTALSGVALAATSGGANAPSHHAHRAVSAGTIGPGATGTRVSNLQRALGVAVTGRYNAATRRAVRRFQAGHGLSVDGVAGPATLAALGIVAQPDASSGGSHAASPAGDVPAALQRIAQCESGGNPQAVSADGVYRGKYQFDRQTWQAIGGSGDPAKAPEADQDRLAAALYKSRGTKPWPNCAA